MPRPSTPEGIAATKVYNKKYWDEHEERHFEQHLQYKFGGKITLAQWKAINEKQHGLCAICKQPEVAKFHGKIRRLAVDHDHETGEIRALLCYHCNTHLGWFEKYQTAVLEHLKRRE